MCGDIRRDYLHLADRIIGAAQGLIYSGEVDQVYDLGFGLLKLVKGDNAGLVHKSGRTILPIVYQEIKLLAGRYVAFKKNGFWELCTVTGYKLTPHAYKDIIVQGDFLLFEVDEGWVVQSYSSLDNYIQDKTPWPRNSFDDFELISDRELWVSKHGYETIMDENFQSLLSDRNGQIRISYHGYIVGEKGQYSFINNDFQVVKDSISQYVKSKSWLGVKKDSLWYLHQSGKDIEIQVDSVQLLGDEFAWIQKKDTTMLLSKGEPHMIHNNQILTLISAINAGQYIHVKSDKKHDNYILNSHGAKILTGEFEDVRAIGPQYLLFTRNGKRGMVSDSSQLLLKPTYDAIGSYKDGYVSLLKGQKFGIYNYSQKVYVPAEYERNVLPYNHDILIAIKNGRQGLIDKKNTRLSDFEYDDVKYWSDSAAFVKKSGTWSIYNFIAGEYVVEGIKSIKILPNDAGRHTCIVLKDSGYGVIDISGKEILSPTYNDIIPLGGTNEQVYFAEKHIAEASLYVVIYFDFAGHVIRKQTFDPDEYSLIYCDN